MINDRGKIKWSSLMLPEHVKKLHDLFEEEAPITKPILSEDQWNDMERIMQQAISSEALVLIKNFKDGHIDTSRIRVQKIDLANNLIIVIDPETEEKSHLYTSDILGVEIVDNQEKP